MLSRPSVKLWKQRSSSTFRITTQQLLREDHSHSNSLLTHVIMVGELRWPNASALMDLGDLSVASANRSAGQSNAGVPLRENSAV